MSTSPDSIEATTRLEPLTRAHDEGVSGTRSWHRHWIWRSVFVPFAASRLALVLAAWLAMNLLPHVPQAGQWDVSSSGKIVAMGANFRQPLVNMWSRWDAGWYVEIASRGYRFSAVQPSNRAFFPLYPMLMRAVHLLVPSDTAGSWFVTGIVIANLSLLAAALYLFQLVRLEFNRATAQRAVLYLLIFPTTFFFSAVYAESLMLALIIGSFYHARNRQWWIAGVFAAAATLARPPGIMIAVGLVAEYLLQIQFNWRKLRLDAVALVFPPLALCGFFTYLRFATGTAMAVVQSQAAWGLRFQPHWKTFGNYFGDSLRLHAPGTHSLVDLVFTLAFVLLTIGVALRLRGSYAIYAFASLAFITAWGSLESVPRYGLGIFPLFILLARLGRRTTIDRAFVCSFMALATMFMILFAMWGWVA